MLRHLSPCRSCLDSLCEARSGGAARSAPALVRSKARLELRSSLGVPVVKAPLREGARFAEGDLLVSFDCRTLAAERAAAQAAAHAAALEAKSKKRLVAHGRGGHGRAAPRQRPSRPSRFAAKSHRRAHACLQAHGTLCRPRRTHRRAPRRGAGRRRTGHHHHRRSAAGGRDRRPVPAGLPGSNRMPGSDFAVEETGATIPGRVTAIGPEVDPVSRTVRLFGSIEHTSRVLPGMSGARDLRGAVE